MTQAFRPITIDEVKVGDEFVATAMGHPCQCNGAYSPNHPCRVKIAKIGRTRVYGFMSGDTTKPTALALNEAQKGLLLMRIEDAKAMYRAGLEEREAFWAEKGVAGLGQAQVDKLVEEL